MPTATASEFLQNHKRETAAARQIVAPALGADAVTPSISSKQTVDEGIEDAYESESAAEDTTSKKPRITKDTLPPLLTLQNTEGIYLDHIRQRLDLRYKTANVSIGDFCEAVDDHLYKLLTKVKARVINGPENLEHFGETLECLIEDVLSLSNLAQDGDGGLVSINIIHSLKEFTPIGIATFLQKSLFMLVEFDNALGTAAAMGYEMDSGGIDDEYLVLYRKMADVTELGPVE